MTLTLNQEQTDVIASRAALVNKTSEQFVVDQLIEPIVAAQRNVAINRLNDASMANLSYTKRQELIAINEAFIAANAGQ